MSRTRFLSLVAVVLGLGGLPTMAADWPMWRCDATRSAASEENLPENLGLLWTADLPALTPAWPNEPRLHFDGVYEPILASGQLLIGSSLDGSLSAFELGTGERRWTFFAEGPIRFAPVAGNGKVYVGADDGYVYCLNLADGKLRWKARGAPEDRPDRRHLGNARLISFWPVRGGLVLADGVVYFAAGIWPTMGVFVVAVDAETGAVVWRNDRLDHIERVRLDHNHLDESGLSPQGYLVVQGDRLLVPNGRSMPAALNRKTGELLYYVQGYRNGDCRVVAAGPVALVGDTGVMDLGTGREMGSRWIAAGNDAPDRFDGAKFHLFEGPIHPYKMVPGCTWQSVISGNLAFGLEKGVFYAYDVQGAKVSEYETKWQDRVLKPWRWDPPLVWKLPSSQPAAPSGATSLIRAGNRLYGHTGKALVAVELPDQGRSEPRIVWSIPLDVPSVRLAAADGRLVVAGSDGTIRCLGATDRREFTAFARPRVTVLDKEASRWTKTAEEILAQSGVREGYGVVLGMNNAALLDELLRQSQLKIVDVSADTASVYGSRQWLVVAGLYGTRAEAFVGDPYSFSLPPYLASLLIAEQSASKDLCGKMPARKLFEILRPYGGTACILAEGEHRKTVERWAAEAGLENAEVRQSGPFVLVRRVGPLPGSAFWTHESADAARSYFSQEQRVKMPLGLLWYGDGPDYGFWKHKDYGTGVKPQVVGGRLFAFQIHTSTLHAYDVYTGRVLWKQPVDRFTRYASVEGGIYVAGGGSLSVLDPATGGARATYPLEIAPGEKGFVADLRVGNGIVVAALAPQKVRVIEDGLWDSIMLVALDRTSGKVLWRRSAQDRFNLHALALGNGMVFCVDSVSPIESEKAKRHGDAPKTLPSTILALDARSGEVRWSTVKENPFRTYGPGGWLGMRGNDDWLAFSETCDLLLVGKQGRAYAFEAATGEPAWEAPLGGQPWILRGETFITQHGAVFQTRTGKPSGKSFPLTRGGCNYAVASPNLLLQRDRSACYVDLDSAQKQSLYAARSGCSNSLIAADGLLNVPCFSVGCVCNYPVQTSFAMVPMPEAAAWSHAEPLPQAFDPHVAPPQR